MKHSALLLSILAFAGLTAGAQAGLTLPPITGPLKLLATPDPDGHREFIDGIQSAKSAIRMTMFHLNDPKAIQALIDAGKRGVDVRVILDRASTKKKEYQQSFDLLEKGGVAVRKSSAGFSISHQKSLVVDGRFALITAINLTQNADRTRDFGVETSDADIIAEILRVFETDWQNAQTGTAATPELKSPNLVWSPVNSRGRLVALIDSAQHDLIGTVENLGDPEIHDALARAAKRGVKARMIVPLCDKNKNPLYDFPFVSALNHAGMTVRMMPYPASPETPYMHSKMLLSAQSIFRPIRRDGLVSWESCSNVRN
jgi:phosphatidylserine/phosphatidylglycerophosphate/cardiolipin synthase-like enzyme